MCGLVGIAGKLALKDEAAMRKLLYLDYFRGPDSTGLAAVRSLKNEVLIDKIASHPLDLFERSRFKQALNGPSSHAFIGHNRAMTRGAINNFNAHPFHFDHIVGAHNGTLDLSAADRLEKELDEKFSVDSMALIAGIAAIGVEKTIEMSSGAWSLVWFNQDDNTINFLRNKERPMWYCWSKEFDRLFWASEWEMLQALTSHYEMHVEKKTDFKYFPTDEDVWYSLDVSDLKNGKGVKPKFKAKKVKGRVAPVTSSAANDHDPFGHRSSERTGRNSGRSTSGPSSSVGKGKETYLKVFHVEGDIDDPFGGQLSRTMFEDMAKDGCCWCQEPVNYSDIGIIVFEADELVMCPSCAGPNTSQTRIYKRKMESAILMPSE